MRKPYKYHWLRHPRTTAEKRANQDRKYVRGRRMPHMLPDTYDDIPISWQRNWKQHRKQQYRIGKRGKRHEYWLPAKSPYIIGDWKFRQYCDNHNIPYDVEHIYEPHIFTRVRTTKRVPYYKRRRWQYRWERNEEGRIVQVRDHQIGWEWVYRTVKLEKPIITKYRGTRYVGTKLIWWSDKDIGLPYILRKQ